MFIGYRNQLGIVNFNNGSQFVYVPSFVGMFEFGGQSNSIGYDAIPVLSSTSQIYGKRISPDVRASGTALTLVNLNEQANPDDVNQGETGAAGMASFLQEHIGSVRSYYGNCGLNSAGISSIYSGTAPFKKGISHVEQAYNIAPDSGLTVLGHVFIHGETDQNAAMTTGSYELLTNKYWSDFTSGVKEKTGQASGVPLLISMQRAYDSSDNRLSMINTSVLNMNLGSPDIFVIYGDKVMYNSAIHLNAWSQRHHGQQAAKVYINKFISGLDWKPLYIESATQTGSTIEVVYHVPVGSIVWGDESIMRTGSLSRGFRFFNSIDNGSGIGVGSVTIMTGSSLNVYLAGSVPEVGSMFLEYNNFNGMHNMDGNSGNLRDSDLTRTVEDDAYLFNFAIPQRLEVGS